MTSEREPHAAAFPEPPSENSGDDADAAPLAASRAAPGTGELPPPGAHLPPPAESLANSTADEEREPGMAEAERAPGEEQEHPTAREESPPGADADQQRPVELDPDELAARAEKAEQYLELAQRTKADFENYRKRASRAVSAAQERGVVKLARELLPAVDNLDRALLAAQSPAGDAAAPDTLVSGVKLVHADLIAALSRVGIEPFSPEGEQFDPQIHEAMAQQPVEGGQPGTIVEVYQPGYRLGEVVLRPARVVVAG